MNRLKLSVVAALFALMGACTTNQAALFPPLPEVEAHVISGAPIQRRTIASVLDDQSLEAEFQQILSSPDVDQTARKQVERVARIFYRTQALMNDYDAKLDQLTQASNASETALLVDDTYARLISAWALREEMLHKIVYFYQRCLETDSDASLLFKRAIRNSVLSATNSTNRLAKQELLRELINVHKEHRESTALLKQQLIEKPEQFYSMNKRQLERETQASLKDQEITGEVESLVPDARAILTEQFQSRTPQSQTTIAPGVGRSGMMNGFEFPKGTWALTFDDGPHDLYTPQALANLKSNGMKATFFWVANNVAHKHDIVSQARAAGMTLANHSYTHANLPRLSPSALTHEIIDSTTVDVRAGYRPKFFRCPYGACGSQTSNVRQKIASLDMVSVTWNVDSLDWQDKNPATVYARVKKQMAFQKRGIILFHDIHPQSIVASKKLMSDFAAGQKNGTYRTVTIDQAFNELNSPEGMK